MCLFDAFTIGYVQRNTDSRATDVACVGGSAAEQERLLWCVSSLMDVFLARSLSRVNEPLNVMFPRATGTALH